MSVTLPLATILAIMLGSIRAVAWLALCPPFNGKGLPTAGKAMLGVALTLPFTDQLADRIATYLTTTGLTTAGLISEVALQITLGAALGLCTQLFISAVQAAGGLIDLFGGFSVAFAFDPFSFTSSAVIGRFYGLAATSLLFLTDSHHVIIGGFARSFRVAPPTGGGISLDRLRQILTSGIDQMFLAAIQIAGPLIAVLFLLDLSLGLLTKVSPSLNAFGLGFPAKILLTLILTGTAIKYLPPVIETIAGQAVAAVIELIGS